MGAWMDQARALLHTVFASRYAVPAVCIALAVATMVHSSVLLAGSPHAAVIGPFALALGGVCLFAAAVVCLAWSALWSPCAVLSTWCACAMFDGLDGRMPIPLSIFTMFAVFLATFRLTGRHPVLGTMTIVPPMYACLVMTMNLPNSGGIPRFLLMCVGESAAVITAIVVRKNRQLAALRQRERQRTLKDRIERTLHDSTANTIVYALSLVDGLKAGHTRDGDRYDATLDDLDATLRRTLTQVRDVIDLMEAPDDPSSDAAMITVPSDATDRLRAAADRMRGHLDRLGFDVELLFDDGNAPSDGAMLSGRLELIEGLLHELEGNVIKHADPHGMVTVSIVVNVADATISLADDPRTQPSSSQPSLPSGGTGLSRYQRLIEETGGSFSLREDNGVWSMTATIPFLS
ncbi:sensor histidine kinase [Bifidobacterium vespertilionis]|uniref:Signal transduction histidine kinase subgroup 3 dimerisation and phosphoacceptor domain-containing protein n=1 Tax=Bifidobacterium vespertilionis TaxID=2562524 RepID=A0A5J5E218_9BIFI|nr:histidine kinase [Bifidobacterium vespertilionis]KAA8818848.1 hypothetical protein EMO90_09295 [Bifidobacterium vespertilionis]KAA8822982.1 hypothetical protein EM848_07355 [Bifidobacterium vespertilionis]